MGDVGGGGQTRLLVGHQQHHGLEGPGAERAEHQGPRGGHRRRRVEHHAGLERQPAGLAPQHHGPRDRVQGVRQQHGGREAEEAGHGGRFQKQGGGHERLARPHAAGGVVERVVVGHGCCGIVG
ncbi:hypothetical protein DC030_14525 [Enterococcus faecalis]|nr:hypothetical protein DC030_14525 [Enterococcus faecalis]